jgi:hypothetical protein
MAPKLFHFHLDSLEVVVPRARISDHTHVAFSVKSGAQTKDLGVVARGIHPVGLAQSAVLDPDNAPPVFLSILAVNAGFDAVAAEKLQKAMNEAADKLIEPPSITPTATPRPPRMTIPSSGRSSGARSPTC